MALKHGPTTAARRGELVSVLHRAGRRDLGRAYLDGIGYALQTDADVICQMDGDLSHRPTDFVATLEAARVADLVIGSRYVPGRRIVNWPLRRRLLSASANVYVRLICSIAVRDCTSGFRCWRRQALAALPLSRVDSEGYAFLVRSLWEGVRMGCTISEVPIMFVKRACGVSKLRLPILLEIGRAAMAPSLLATPDSSGLRDAVAKPSSPRRLARRTE